MMQDFRTNEAVSGEIQARWSALGDGPSAQLAKRILARAALFLPECAFPSEILLELIQAPRKQRLAGLAKLLEVRLLSQASEALEIQAEVAAFALSQSQETAAQLYQQVGKKLADRANQLRNQAQPEELIAWRAHLLEIAKTSLEQGYPIALELANALGSHYYQVKEWESAELWLRRALEFAEAHAQNDARLASPLSNLALLLKERKQFQAAEPLMRQALQLNEARYGAEHPMVGLLLTNLAGLLMESQRFEEAIPPMRRALAIEEASGAAAPAQLLVRLTNLATLLQLGNRQGEALPLVARAYAISLKSQGPEAQATQILGNNLAFLKKQGYASSP